MAWGFVDGAATRYLSSRAPEVYFLPEYLFEYLLTRIVHLDHPHQSDTSVKYIWKGPRYQDRAQNVVICRRFPAQRMRLQPPPQQTISTYFLSLTTNAVLRDHVVPFDLPTIAAVIIINKITTTIIITAIITITATATTILARSH